MNDAATRKQRTTLATDPHPMRRYSLAEPVDAVVIGTGAGGAPTLTRLAQAGLKVVALEAGSFLDPAEYATDEAAQNYLYWLDERLSVGDQPVAFGKNNSGTGVGGSMLHWGAYAPRADRRDFHLARELGLTSSGASLSSAGAGSTSTVEARDWPLTYDDLLPYYEEVERFLGVSGPEHYPWDPSRRYPLGPLPFNAPAELMQRGCDAIGMRTAAAPIAALSRDYSGPSSSPDSASAEQGDYPLRHACVNRGYCHQGCRNGAKASMDVTYLPVAVRAGAEIRANAFVTDLERDPQGRITAVVYQQEAPDGTHEELRQPTNAVFLCAGAVETPRLLLRLGLANSSGQVGRNFMAHTSTQIWGTFDEETRPWKGYPTTLISEDTLRPRDANFAGGYLIQSYGILPATWADSVARGRGLWGPELLSYLRDYPRVAGMGINGECLPSPTNYLELSNEFDTRGLPKPRIHFSAGPNEKALMAHGERVLADIWSAAGASDTWTFGRFAHSLGTCRMGSDPTDSVVDPWNKAHDLPNLYISDHSIFPSAQAANPAITIISLALRAADRFLGRV